ncbi:MULTISPECIES: WecB/TagA/CpsF family glycosyltransferase [unclassified Sporolactobacillus]|uniref:WecB/TagA/CpsF family glycosyltransferase n=1 Tax=unclassified Sporolactobacillus TaxID=2628533 RepID=UPI002368E884|nr:WecB/TagA/CpsF family glycosyltransferase [Sporolactobacillus sp. CQH2019]MDD9149634.1 WecB/TagA/CpsF family glycosyltransferase [Sporolactobacillus sp. CQH2019]
MKKIAMFSIEIDNVGLEEAAEYVIEMGTNKNSYDYVVTPNVDHIMRLQTDDEFKKVYDHAALILADGQPIVWGSKLLGQPLKERVSGSDLFPLVCKASVSRQVKLFFLGAREGVARKAADNLSKKFGPLNIVGIYSPPLGFERDDRETRKIIKMINAASPDILFVGVGTPKQEKWIFNNLRQLKVPVSLGIGASFDFEAGIFKRAPHLLQRTGLEWFWRFVHEPRRLFRRYLMTDTRFLFLILDELKKKNSRQKLKRAGRKPRSRKGDRGLGS